MTKTLGRRLPKTRLPLPAFGTKFGRLTVIANLAYKDQKNGQIKFAPMCRCECGNVKQVRIDHLISGRVVACGCYRKEAAAKALITHGKAHTPEYNVWNTMRGRVLNPNTKSYKNYGAKGLMIEPDWAESFEAFFADMGPRPAPHLTLERVDNDLGYVRGNVVWDTRKVQAGNTSRNDRMGWASLLRRPTPSDES